MGSLRIESLATRKKTTLGHNPSVPNSHRPCRDLMAKSIDHGQGDVTLQEYN